MLGTYGIIAITSVVSLTAIFSSDGQAITEALALYKPAVAEGQWWRLWTVTLVHDGPIHLLFNMYALWLAGSIAEQVYGTPRFIAFYLVCAAAGSIASFAFGAAPAAVGASGAVFGIFGLVFVANRLHMLVLDRRSRGYAAQIGTLILINIVFGLAVPFVDNFAHIGGLVAGALLGLGFVPAQGMTLRSRWEAGHGRPIASGVIGSAIMSIVVSLVLLGLLAAGYAIGVNTWS
jgi:rhomboid protease GluP